MKPALIGLLLMLACSAGRGADARWKYFTLTVVLDAKGYHAFGDDGQRIGAAQAVAPASTPGTPSGDEPTYTLTHYLNLLGASGWELVSIVASNNVTTQYIFKQPKTNTASVAASAIPVPVQK